MANPVHAYVAETIINETPALSSSPLREAVGLFSNPNDLQNAIRELEGTAFPRHDISVMANETELERVFGVRTVLSERVMDDSRTPREAPPRPEEQTIGSAAAIGGSAYVGAMALALAAGALSFPAIIGAVIVGGIGGGAVGAALTRIMGDKYNHHLEDQLRNGGLLLWVRTPNIGAEDLAMKILQKNGAKQVHVHDIS